MVWEAAVVQLEVKRTEAGMAGYGSVACVLQRSQVNSCCHKNLCVDSRAGIGAKLKLQSAETDPPAVEILHFMCTMLLAAVKAMSGFQRRTPKDSDG